LPANVYECMLLLDSNRYNADANAVVNQVHNLLEKHHAEILASRPWDERRLAFPIKKHKKGTYYLIYFRMEGKNLRPLEQDFELNENILRTLVLKVNPKLVDTMLALARDEHALAVQAPGLADEPPEPARGAPPGEPES
jgi:small subunit ribosomal protein S6